MIQLVHESLDDESVDQAVLCHMPEVLAIQDYSVHTDLVSRTISSQLPEFLGLCLGFFLIAILI